MKPLQHKGNDMIFKISSEGQKDSYIYLEEYEIGSKTMYQAMYSNGCAVSELEEDKNKAMAELKKEIERIANTKGIGQICISTK